MSRALRIANTERQVNRQRQIAKQRGNLWFQPETEWHRFAKRKWANCGSPRCLMCQNPRKRGELTMQEKRLMQRGNEPLDD